MKDRVKSILPWAVVAFVFLILVLLNIVAGDHWLDSDMAAEMIFSKQIAEEGGLFATKNWYYSTEFRILYTQLVMVPLFHILESWHVIRMITNIVTYILLLGSYYYFMKPLCSKKSTVLYSSVILLLPFSEVIMTHMQMGNTYMPHMIIIFFCAGMFLRLAAGSRKTTWGKLSVLLFYILLCVICGMSGVRYVLALQAPLVLAAIWTVMKTAVFEKLRKEVNFANIKALLQDKQIGYLWYSLLGLFCAMVGYLINIVVIARTFPFQTYEATNFIQVFQGILLERLQNTFGNLLLLFGYIENKGFLSARGVISLIAIAMMIGVALLTIRCSKLLQENKEESVQEYDLKAFLWRFFVAAFVLNTFVFVFTTSTMTARYYFTVFMFVLPLICIYFDLEKLPLDRILVAMFLCGTLGLTSLKGVYSFLDKDKNQEEKQAAQFLEEQEYAFGYATYWNANIMTELTNGYVEVANVSDVDQMSMFLWSSPKKYYEESYHTGKTFLLLTVEEAAKYANSKVVQKGEMIYKDDTYIIYHYDAVEELF